MGRNLRMWIPNQHGAWAMALTPAVVGTLGAGLGAEDAAASQWLAVALLLLAWFIGYCAFFSFGLLARARTPRRRKQYLPPVLTYGTIATVAVLLLLTLVPAVLWWAVCYVPLIGIAVLETLRAQPRSLLSGAATTVASALLVSVLGSIMGARISWDSPVVLATVFLALYFTGTIPLVKTIIRDRDSAAMLRFSIGFHLIALAVMAAYVVAARAGAPGWCMVGVLLLALARACYFPLSARRGRTWRAKQIGMAEVVPCVLAGLAALWALLD